jgi:hypothetical protein
VSDQQEGQVLWTEDGRFRGVIDSEETKASSDESSGAYDNIGDAPEGEDD